MIFAIYKRTASGQVSFHGLSDFDSVEAFIQCHDLGAFGTQPSCLSHEWPDRDLVWCGPVGYALRNSGKLKMRQVNLTDHQVKRAKEIGGGNVSEGIRMALSLFE